MYKLFVVEDEIGIANEIKNVTSNWNIETFIAKDFQNVLKEFLEISPQIVLLDISLPFMNGYYWCSEIRKVSKAPIIFISSAKETMNVVMAMNMGADDFIAKPFDMDVLIAKIQALLRRTYDFSSEISVIEHKGAILNVADGTFIYKNETIELTKNEYKILLVLMENKCKIVSRQKIMESLWKSNDFVDENTLTVNINRLRKKLANYGLENFIETKFGNGYILAK